MPDPITLAVISNRLAAITAEMGEAMLRTSYSQILNSSRDFSIALVDAEARLIAQADHIPVHVGALPWAVRGLLETFPEPEEGAVYLLNDPYHGGSHLPDLTIFIPVFATSGPLLYAVVRAHQSDIGGATHGAYNAAATELWQEGLRIPPIRLTEAGSLREDLLGMLAANVRHARDFRGDLAAMIGAARLGAARIEATLTEFGATTLAAAIEAILDATESNAREIVSAWRDGTYEGEATLDDDGHGRRDIRIRARVIKEGGCVTVDLSASDPESTGFVNSSYANMRSAVAMAFAFLLDPDLPRNDGAFRPLRVVARPGTIVWANPPAPVTLCTSHCANEIVEAVIVALAPACPMRAMAGWARRFRIAIDGIDPRTRRRFIWHLFQARPGGGASSAGDGWPAAGEWHSAGGLKFGSIEVTEVRFPLFFERHEFRPGSGGHGQFRGGHGSTLRFAVETEGPALANTAGDGTRHGARGILGGEDGKPHDYRLVRPGEPARAIATKETGIVVPPGSRFLVCSGGGGGWGDPAARDPALIARDADEERA
ncbi:MAG: hydantoinase B/oxoprolinase family protein [Acetobacteraceae bacterium]